MSRNLSELRASLGWSQRRLAPLLCVAQNTLARYETGTTIPPPVLHLIDLLERDIAAGLDVTAPGYRIGFGASAENPAADFTGQGAGL